MIVTVLAVPFVAGANNTWGVYHWANTTAPTVESPITLSLGDNVSGTWLRHLTTANTDWNVSAVFENTIDDGRTNPKRCNPASGLVEICSSKYGANGWLGVAGIWVSDSHITKGYVKVNDTYFNTATYGTDAWRQLVMCQEVGHLFGLGHQDEDFSNANLNTCMDYTGDPESNQHPDDHDFATLDGIYIYGDGFDSWSLAPAADEGGGKGNKGKNGKNNKNGNPPGADIRQWGKAISNDGKGRPDLFELDLGNGNRLFTHVFWAD